MPAPTTNRTYSTYSSTRRRAITVIPHNYKEGFCMRTFKLVTFIPLAFLFLERLYLPIELGSVASYLDVESVAVTTKIKNPTIGKKIAPPLPKLTDSYSWNKFCSDTTILVADTQLPDKDVLGRGKIPKIIHQTAKHRCVTPAFLQLTQKWKDRFTGYSYYFHDDDAMNRLLEMDFPEFPHLKTILRNCVTNGTLKADLWRYLVLWVYGGIYADFDSAPNEISIETFKAEYDALFVVEQYHILSQWFIAVSPRHPLMYYAIQQSLLNLLQAEDTLKIGAHLVTGPHALHQGFMKFAKDSGMLIEPLGAGFKPVWANTFVGTDNRTVTAIGKGEFENQYVTRTAISPAVRKRDYKEMGMVHFSRFTQPNAQMSHKSCADARLDDITSALIHNNMIH